MLKVCFVDDDSDVSQLFKYVGESERLWTVSFTSGTDALQFLEQNQVDVVVLDLAMPILDGLTVAEEIRRNEENRPERKKVKIAFMSGAEINDAILRVAERVGAEKIFKKPCDLSGAVKEIKGWFVKAGK